MSDSSPLPSPMWPCAWFRDWQDPAGALHLDRQGRCFAELSDEQLFRLYPDEQLEIVTPNSIRSRDELVAELVRTRLDGYAVNRQESEDGVASVAVPVHVSSGLRLAINASAPVQRLPPGKVKSLARSLQDAAIRLAELLG
ncbi:IclR family transcriptional regulator C-terminal domain-containing protein [Microbacterium sp. NRRL B-14842]|uniref:IclR family transcriptional regulator domain-containing protein n=1 Tax=Microbacterium sp. NRRL B-14842 TaxID=3162881 RepID=UPI003D28CEE9